MAEAEKRRTPVLMSYAFLRDMTDEQVRDLVSASCFELLLDCGAFTALNAGAEIDLDDYIAFIEKWKRHLFGYIALDVLGNPAQTDANLQSMLREGLKPIPVHVRGDGKKRMDELFGMSDIVAFGGLRRPHRGPASLSYVKQKMGWAAGRKAHWLGYTNAQSIATFKPYSVDCSSWASGLRWGVFSIYLGGARWSAKQWSVSRVLAGERLTIEEERVVRAARIELSDFYNPLYWRHSLNKNDISYHNSAISVIPAHSWVRYSDDVRRYWGTWFFLAMFPDHTSVAARLWIKELYEHGRASIERPPTKRVMRETVRARKREQQRFRTESARKKDRLRRRAARDKA